VVGGDGRRLEAGQGQEIRQHAIEVGRRARQVPHEALRDGRLVERSVFEQLDGGADGGERGLQIVPGVAQESGGIGSP
jgi:hypothetical protein